MVSTIKTLSFTAFVFFLTMNSILVAGQKEWTTNGPQGGGLTTLAVDPTNSSVLYAGSQTAGLFKSTDGGTTWQSINDGTLDAFGSLPMIQALAVDPKTPATIYAASLNGVYRSMNAGGHWDFISLHATDMHILNLLSIAINPLTPTTIYIAGGLDVSDSRIYRSLDGGQTWSQLSAGLTGLGVLAVAVDPINPLNVYVGDYGGGVYRSSNGGDTWQTANVGLSTLEVTTMRFDPGNPGNLYLAVDRSNGVGGVFRSADGGATWQPLSSDGLPASLSIVSITFADRTLLAGSEQGIYKREESATRWTLIGNGISGVPIRRLLAVDTHTIYAASDMDGLFKSTDGGASWSPSNGGLFATSVTGIAVDTRGHLFASANFGGVFESQDAGETWTQQTPGLTGSGGAVAVDPINPARLFLAVSDSFGFYRSTDGGVTWSPTGTDLAGTVVTQIAIDPSSPDILYTGTFFGGIFKSLDAGKTWTGANTGYPSGFNGYTPALVIDPMRPNILYAAANQGLYKSIDAGGSWSSSGSGISGLLGPFVRSLAIDPISPDVLYAGTLSGIFKSTNSAASWSRIDANLPGLIPLNPPNVLAVLVDPTPPNTILIGVAGAGVFKQTVGSGSWIPMNTGLQNSRVIALAKDPTRPGVYYAATDFGVFTISTLDVGHSQVNLSLGGNAASSTTSLGTSNPLAVGYATVDVNSGSTPYGTAVFSFTQNGQAISEAGVPASPPTTHAEVFIDLRTNVAAKSGERDANVININTGVAAVNRGSALAHIQMILRDLTGTIIRQGATTLAANGHFAKFIDQFAPDLVLPPDFATATRNATLELISDQPLSLLALRVTENQRQESLITTTPIADLTQPDPQDMVLFPQIVDGGGYQTTLFLLNTTGTVETGTIQIFDDDGAPLPSFLNEGGQAAASISYTLPPRGARLLTTGGGQSAIRAGSVRVVPNAGSITPIGAGVFGFTSAGILITESGIPSSTLTTRARIYVDKSGGHNTGLALADASGVPRTFQFSVTNSDGTTQVANISLPANGHTARFADQLLSGLSNGFQGVMDITSNVPFAALTLRSLNNARGDGLLTTFPTADLTRPAPSPVIFPQIADGGGYSTQIILINSTSGASSAAVSFFGESGSPLPVGK